MELWRAVYDPRTRRHRHRTRAVFGHALLAPFASTIFRTLRVSAAVWEHGEEWLAFNSEPGFFGFEFEHSHDIARAAYNDRMLERVQRHKRAVLGEHAGYQDLFF